MSYSFQPLSDEELDAINIIPKGIYSFEVSKSTRKTSRAGNPMAELKHQNNGNCPKCLEVIFKYVDPYEPLVEWFMETQKLLPEAHCSEFGREEKRQMKMFSEKKSRAKWKESAHNWNAAIDVFRNCPGNIYDEDWFRGEFAKHIPEWLDWYGRIGSRFQELPHLEPKDWKALAENAVLRLVRPTKGT